MCKSTGVNSLRQGGTNALYYPVHMCEVTPQMMRTQRQRRGSLEPRASVMECGGKRSATPLSNRRALRHCRESAFCHFPLQLLSDSTLNPH